MFYKFIFLILFCHTVLAEPFLISSQSSKSSAPQKYGLMCPKPSRDTSSSPSIEDFDWYQFSQNVVDLEKLLLEINPRICLIPNESAELEKPFSTESLPTSINQLRMRPFENWVFYNFYKESPVEGPLPVVSLPLNSPCVIVNNSSPSYGFNSNTSVFTNGVLILDQLEDSLGAITENPEDLFEEGLDRELWSQLEDHNYPDCQFVTFSTNDLIWEDVTRNLPHPFPRKGIPMEFNSYQPSEILMINEIYSEFYQDWSWNHELDRMMEGPPMPLPFPKPF